MPSRPFGESGQLSGAPAPPLKPKQKWTPGIAERPTPIAELFLQSRQHYASLFKTLVGTISSSGCGSAALTIRADANPQRMPFFVLLGAKLAPRGANLCAPETREDLRWADCAYRSPFAFLALGASANPAQRARRARFAAVLFNCGKLRFSLHYICDSRPS